MIRALLVDLDGTLADSVGHLKRVFFDFLSAYGIQGTEKEFVSLTGASLHAIIHELKQRYSLSPTHEALYNQYAQQVISNYATQVKTMPGALETLRLAKQKKIKLALVSSASIEMSRQFLASNDLNDLFDALVCAQREEPGKPHPALYLRALQMLNVSPREAVAVEDSINGVKSALAASCEVFWLTSEELPVFEEQIYLVRNWSEINKWVEAL